MERLGRDGPTQAVKVEHKALVVREGSLVAVVPHILLPESSSPEEMAQAIVQAEAEVEVDIMAEADHALQELAEEVVILLELQQMLFTRRVTTREMV